MGIDLPHGDDVAAGAQPYGDDLTDANPKSETVNIVNRFTSAAGWGTRESYVWIAHYNVNPDGSTNLVNKTMEVTDGRGVQIISSPNQTLFSIFGFQVFLTQTLTLQEMPAEEAVKRRASIFGAGYTTFDNNTTKPYKPIPQKVTK